MKPNAERLSLLVTAMTFAMPLIAHAQASSEPLSEADAVATLSPVADASVPAVGVRDTLDLGTTSITGNQELPKVLYIVPWKRSDLGDLLGRPANTLLDEVLAPVDPEVFERHLSYYGMLYDNGDGSPAEGRRESAAEKEQTSWKSIPPS